MAEFAECKRKDGVLNVKIRLHNVSSADMTTRPFHWNNFQTYYVMAANKKYFILKDSDGTYLTPAVDGIGDLEVHLAKDQHRDGSDNPDGRQKNRRVELTLQTK